MANYAIEHKQPACPKCLNPLERPDYFSKLPTEEKFSRFTVPCKVCNIVVQAYFLYGRGE